MLTWEQLCNDKRFEDLPFKIELNGRGQIIMSPRHLHQGRHTSRIASLMERSHSVGEITVKCGVETADGVKEADVAWLSTKLAKEMHYIGAGAREYWLCDKEGRMRFYDEARELDHSMLRPKFPTKLPLKR